MLLQVIPRIVDRFPLVRFTLAGCDCPRGRAMTEQFRARYPILIACKKVVFPANRRRQQDELAAARHFCGTVPLRILWPGVRGGHDVLDAGGGCRTGGVPEVVDDGVTGLLAEPGDPDTLYDAWPR